ATVYAAAGGAASTTSVDLSRTYIEWGRRNLALNALTGEAHAWVQADCREWLTDAARGSQRFDLVFLDPPTFSNSKRMQGVHDIGALQHPQVLGDRLPGHSRATGQLSDGTRLPAAERRDERQACLISQRRKHRSMMPPLRGAQVTADARHGSRCSSSAGSSRRHSCGTPPRGGSRALCRSRTR